MRGRVGSSASARVSIRGELPCRSSFEFRGYQKAAWQKPRGQSGTHAEGDYTSRALDERQDEQEVPRGAPLSLAEKRYPWRNPTHTPSRLALRNRSEHGGAQPCVSAVGSDEVRLLFLGGTGPVGMSASRIALARGHEVIVAHSGKH